MPVLIASAHIKRRIDMESRSFGLDVLRSIAIWMGMIVPVAYWSAPPASWSGALTSS